MPHVAHQMASSVTSMGMYMPGVVMVSRSGMMVAASLAGSSSPAAWSTSVLAEMVRCFSVPKRISGGYSWLQLPEELCWVSKWINYVQEVESGMPVLHCRAGRAGNAIAL